MMTGQEDSKVMNLDCPVNLTYLSVSIINNSVVISHPKVYILFNFITVSSDKLQIFLIPLISLETLPFVWNQQSVLDQSVLIYINFY